MTLSTTIMAFATAMVLQSASGLATTAMPVSNQAVVAYAQKSDSIILATSTDPAAESLVADVSAQPVGPATVPDANVESAVKSYFADIPIMISIAQCESNFRQFNSNDTIFRGTINREDVGVMQINQYYNGESAKRLGYDILSLAGNMAFARHLYDIYGTQPWSASEKCWDPTAVVAVKTGK